MQREYTRDEYLERIGWIRQARRPISISTDIIAGFPGETAADFEESLTLLEEVGFDSIFSFQYSPRPDTASLAFEDAIPEEEKMRRLRVLQERQRNIQIQRNQTLLGTVQEVLVEGRNSHQEQGKIQWKGRTTQNMVLNFTVPDELASAVSPGEYREVRVTKAGPNSLVGEAVGELCLSTSPASPWIPLRVL
jgi:tRNA-2-methylthio-N6-dimethylallyladenosine synthase